MLYSFTEDEFVEQVKRSKNWGEPTSGLFEMMREIVTEEARTFGGSDCVDKNAMVYSAIKDFESGDLLQGLVMNSHPELGGVFDNFKSSICCTFNHYKRKQE